MPNLKKKIAPIRALASPKNITPSRKTKSGSVSSDPDTTLAQPSAVKRKSSPKTPSGPRTQSQLAKLAKVSRLTVSRAFAGEPGVSEETRARILELARKHSYRPNAAARALQATRFDSVLFLAGLSGAAPYLPHSLLTALAEECTACGLKLIYAHGREPGPSLDRLLADLCCDGIIIGNFAYDRQTMVDQVRREPVPAVWLNDRRESDSVYSDEKTGARLAVEHLVQLGHTRLAYIHDRWQHTNRDLGHYSEDDRRDGCSEAVAALNAEAGAGSDADQTNPPITLTVKAAERRRPLGAETLREELRALLAAPGSPTGVIAYSEEEFLLVQRAANECGLRIPENLSIVVFTWGGPLITALNPTAIRGDEKAMAAAALALLQGRWASESAASPPVARPPRLVIGSTTAPVSP